MTDNPHANKEAIDMMIEQFGDIKVGENGTFADVIKLAQESAALVHKNAKWSAMTYCSCDAPEGLLNKLEEQFGKAPKPEEHKAVGYIKLETTGVFKEHAAVIVILGEDIGDLYTLDLGTLFECCNKLLLEVGHLEFEDLMGGAANAKSKGELH